MFKNLTVVSFESRQAEAMTKMIQNEGGTPLSAPSMQEIPLEKNPEAFAFAERFFRGEIDVLILTTGVGTRYLVQALETKEGFFFFDNNSSACPETSFTKVPIFEWVGSKSTDKPFSRMASVQVGPIEAISEF